VACVRRRGLCRHRRPGIPLGTDRRRREGAPRAGLEGLAYLLQKAWVALTTGYIPRSAPAVAPGGSRADSTRTGNRQSFAPLPRHSLPGLTGLRRSGVEVGLDPSEEVSEVLPRLSASKGGVGGERWRQHRYACARRAEQSGEVRALRCQSDASKKNGLCAVCRAFGIRAESAPRSARLHT